MNTESERDLERTREAIGALRTILDPEVGVNLVDLGLIDEVHVEGERAVVRLFLTTPACPAAGAIIQGIERSLRTAVAGVTEVAVTLVLDRPWTAERITPEGRLQLGW